MTWMMGYSAPSASFLMTPNWEERLIDQLLALAFRGTLKSPAINQQEFYEVQQKEIQSPAPREE